MEESLNLLVPRVSSAEAFLDWANCLFHPEPYVRVPIFGIDTGAAVELLLERRFQLLSTSLDGLPADHASMLVDYLAAYPEFDEAIGLYRQQLPESIWAWSLSVAAALNRAEQLAIGLHKAPEGLSQSGAAGTRQEQAQAFMDEAAPRFRNHPEEHVRQLQLMAALDGSPARIWREFELAVEEHPHHWGAHWYMLLAMLRAEGYDEDASWTSLKAVLYDYPEGDLRHALVAGYYNRIWIHRLRREGECDRFPIGEEELEHYRSAFELMLAKDDWTSHAAAYQVMNEFAFGFCYAGDQRGALATLSTMGKRLNSAPWAMLGLPSGPQINVFRAGLGLEQLDFPAISL